MAYPVSKLLEGDPDDQIRLAAFDFLTQLQNIHGDTLPRRKLEQGFEFQGTRVPLMGPQGIFTPQVMHLPLSFTTVPTVLGQPRPYEDQVVSETGGLLYKYRGTDPDHRDNVGLRKAMKLQVPLIYFFGIVPGQYLAVWPAFVVRDNPKDLLFAIEFDDSAILKEKVSETADSMDEGRRRYITVQTQRRLHQQAFRERVLIAYRQQCAVCRLRHRELLEAAHILPDKHPHGDPVVSNGLSLCKLHHAAFDSNILGIRPDLTIDIRLDILKEKDGPMLEHGLQGFQDKLISIPLKHLLRPNPTFLDERYQLFRAGK